MGVASNILELNSKSGGFLDFFSRRFFQKQMHFFEVLFEWKNLLQYLLHKCYDLKVLDGVLWKNENFKNNFFSWSEFCYWTKIKTRHVFLTKIMLLNKIYTFLIFLWRSSRQKTFCEKGVFRNVTKFTGKHLCQNHFLNKASGLRPASSYRTSLAAASVYFFSR